MKVPKGYWLLGKDFNTWPAFRQYCYATQCHNYFQLQACLFIGPILICVNLKLQLSTDHASLNIAHLIVIRSVYYHSIHLIRNVCPFKTKQQNEQTWVNMQMRLNKVRFPYARLFASSEVHNFVKNKALLVGCCKGYFIPLRLTTMAYLLTSSQATVKTLTHSKPLNVYTIFVGYPGTGKFFAFSSPTSASNLFM